MYFRKYKNYEDFYAQNQKNFDCVQMAAAKMKSVNELSQTGSALAEAEKLTFDFLNLSSLCSDLLFGLSSSVLDAKSDYKRVEGIFHRASEEKSVAAKEKLCQCDPDYIETSKRFNELTDIFEYITNKKRDFESAYYYYRNMNSDK